MPVGVDSLDSSVCWKYGSCSLKLQISKSEGTEAFTIASNAVRMKHVRCYKHLQRLALSSQGSKRKFGK
eukprot:snap_masked-scaffold_15-processed-gene-4.31-mRNA-1 protein AED:1.00 eAED:1.00 QI:0/0/0/0/1/1/2/0/68